MLLLPCPVLRQTAECVVTVRLHSYHRFAVAEALHNFLACPCQETDTAENLLVKNDFMHLGLSALTPVVDIQNHNAFGDLVADAQNPSRLVIREVKSQHVQGVCTVAQGTNPKQAEPLYRFLSEHTHFKLKLGYRCNASITWYMQV